MKRIRTKLILGVLLALGTASAAFAQGEIASGTISGGGSGPFSYSLSFSDGAGATSPIGSVWYSWIPGFFYLPSSPTSASAPTGWTASISGNSVQYIASSATYDIQPGHSLSGFGYQATFSPAQLAAAPNSGDSFAYSAGLFSDNGEEFIVQAVPEPSSLGLLGAGVLVLTLAGRRQLRNSTGVS
ncbi:MAG TPA: PEP-CTERM sorting domain-containing protein [Candidatus Acidoferrales bacterium]|nr:PEP-CTERM sorting domain-containing protein [Candidatus Acidoferrales bacterium]